MSDTQQTTPATEVSGGPYYKVLSAGHSVHGGTHAWGLPTADGPGEWQTLPPDTNGMPALCQQGFHLTSEPAKWFGPGYTVYLAEYRGRVDGPREGSDADKIAVEECRLVRPATPDELALLGIYTEGVHECRRAGQSFATGSARVTAYGSAQVTAYDSARVTATGSARVTAYGSAQVTAEGRVTVMRQSRRASISLLGLAVSIDWTGERAELIRADPTPETAPCSAT